MAIVRKYTPHYPNNVITSCLSPLVSWTQAQTSEITEVPTRSVESTRWSIGCRLVRRTQDLIVGKGAAQQRLPGRAADQLRKWFFCGGFDESRYKRLVRTCRQSICLYRPSLWCRNFESDGGKRKCLSHWSEHNGHRSLQPDDRARPRRQGSFGEAHFDATPIYIARRWRLLQRRRYERSADLRY